MAVGQVWTSEFHSMVITAINAEAGVFAADYKPSDYSTFGARGTFDKNGGITVGWALTYRNNHTNLHRTQTWSGYFSIDPIAHLLTIRSLTLTSEQIESGHSPTSVSYETFYLLPNNTDIHSDTLNAEGVGMEPHQLQSHPGARCE